MIAQSLKKGLKRISQLPLLLSCFFMYQLLWGILLYLVIKSVLLPMLFRMPHQETAPEWFQFFLIENQIRFVKTDDFVPILILAFTLIGLRFLITPLLNAGLYYALREQRPQPQLRLFTEGVKRYSLSFFFIHVGQWIMMLLPFIVYVTATGVRGIGAEQLLQNKTLLFAIITGTCLYFIFIRLVAMYICFGRLENTSFFGSVAKWGRHALPTVLIAIGMFIFYMLAYSVLSALTVNAAGFTALLIYFGSYSARLLFKWWEVATLQHYYSAEHE